MNRYQHYYSNIICYDLVFKDHFLNPMQLPKLSNLTLNIGLGNRAVLDKKQIFITLAALELISGQKACYTTAKKSVDKFKLRQDMPIGCKVTLRNFNMFHFLDRFVHETLPSIDLLKDWVDQKVSRTLSFQKATTRRVFPSTLVGKMKPRISSMAKLSSFSVHSDSSSFSRVSGTLATLNSRNTDTSLSHSPASFFHISSHSVPNLLQDKLPKKLSVLKTKALAHPPFSFGSSFAHPSPYVAFSFGLPDYFSFDSVPYDLFGFQPSYGLNLQLQVKFISNKKSNHLFFPHYFLSCFHLPLGLPSLHS